SPCCLAASLEQLRLDGLVDVGFGERMSHPPLPAALPLFHKGYSGALWKLWSNYSKLRVCDFDNPAFVDDFGRDGLRDGVWFHASAPPVGVDPADKCPHFLLGAVIGHGGIVDSAGSLAMRFCHPCH